ncbi:MAG TPA: biotin/lipoyl-containing protein [Bryobacteraceae bacterium]|jgi:biotin carboxyl carrier protein|nr:biotin/lipoyl-containing protein [Bryobacteraceae bacterium]
MKLQILVNGRLVPVDAEDVQRVAQVEPGVYSVLLGGRSFEVRAVAARDGLRLELSGRRFTAEVRDPRDRAQKSAAALGTGRQNIAAPMPGKVVRVLVGEGDVVEVGQGLVVVEAMKMQNEMKALRGGNVVEVRVRDGDTVSAGDVLVVLG